MLVWSIGAESFKQQERLICNLNAVALKLFLLFKAFSSGAHVGHNVGKVLKQFLLMNGWVNFYQTWYEVSLSQCLPRISRIFCFEFYKSLNSYFPQTVPSPYDVSVGPEFTHSPHEWLDGLIHQCYFEPIVAGEENRGKSA